MLKTMKKQSPHTEL